MFSDHRWKEHQNPIHGKPIIRVPAKWCVYTTQPEDGKVYTDSMNRVYTRYAKAYDGFIAAAPFWGRWLQHVLPYIEGERILEVSFGPGYLLTKYPENCKVYGLDYNALMVQRAKVKVLVAGKKAKLREGNVEAMPYPDDFFDTIVNTMAFSGYPYGEKAMVEMLRVLKPQGRLIILDYDYPEDRNFWGFLMVRFMEVCGDIMKDLGKVIEDQGATYTRKTVGGWGSVQLFVVQKN